MAALSSNSASWQTPPWLVDACRASLGGYITLDAASCALANVTVQADAFMYEDGENALEMNWDQWQVDHCPHPKPTLFLNPPGGDRGRLIRKFWERWNHYSLCGHFHASVWVDFNLDHLRFIKVGESDTLVVPRKRMAFVDPGTQKPVGGAQIGGFILFRGAYRELDGHFPEEKFLHLRGPAL